jgi:hypothetical protein
MSNGNDDDWDDVFVQAAGGDGGRSTTTDRTAADSDSVLNHRSPCPPPPSQQQQREQQQQRKRKRQHRQICSDNNSNNSRIISTTSPTPQLRWCATFLTKEQELMMHHHHHHDDDEEQEEDTAVEPTRRPPQLPILRHCVQYCAATGTKDHHHDSDCTFTTTTTTTTIPCGGICTQCQQPSGCHRLQLLSVLLPSTHPTTSDRHFSVDRSIILHLSLWVAVRNLRCYCRIQLFVWSYTGGFDDVDANDHHRSIFLRPLLQELQQLHVSILDTTAAATAARTSHASVLFCDITIRNLQFLMHHVQEMMRHMNHDTDTDTDTDYRKVMIPYVQCIMKCDDVYYRLYYNDHIASRRDGVVPDDRSWTTSTAQQQQQRNALIIRIPHPITYFSEWIPFDALGKNLDGEHTLQPDENPLYRLYLYRTMETESIFCTHPRIHLSNTAIRCTPPIIASSIHSTTTTTTTTTHQQRTTKSHPSQQHQHHHHPPIVVDTSSFPLLLSLLTEWNHSCRDFLCHLYCYATISNTVLEQVVTTLHDDYQCAQLVEIGAGTGYLAHWLHHLSQQRRQQQHPPLPHGKTTTTTNGGRMMITAYDIAPNNNNNYSNSKKKKKNAPRVTNEYHADMAGFYYPVLYGDTQTSWTHYYSHVLRHHDRNRHHQDSSSGSSSPPIRSATTFALLLCYPPPDSTMAYDAIRNYCRVGGGGSSSSSNHNAQIVVHIGEFKGLTGNRNFEHYLIQNFVCVRRWSCCIWGCIDASTISIWIQEPQRPEQQKRMLHVPVQMERNDDKDIGSRLLLPCSYCRVRESTRRCQWVRSIAYCSEECFVQDYSEEHHHHEGNTNKEAPHKQLYYFLKRSHELDFDNEQHFSRLAAS